MYFFTQCMFSELVHVLVLAAGTGLHIVSEELVTYLHVIVPVQCTHWQQSSPVYTPQPGFHGGEGQLVFTRPNWACAQYSQLSNCWVDRMKAGRCCLTALSLLHGSTVKRWNKRHVSEHFVSLWSSKHTCVTGESTDNDQISGQLIRVDAGFLTCS